MFSFTFQIKLSKTVKYSHDSEFKKCKRCAVGSLLCNSVLGHLSPEAVAVVRFSQSIPDLVCVSSANLLCAGPVRECFGFGGPASSFTWLNCPRSGEAGSDGTSEQKRGCVPVTFYIWTLRFGFHVIFTYYKILVFMFFQTLKKCENHAYLTGCTKT